MSCDPRILLIVQLKMKEGVKKKVSVSTFQILNFTGSDVEDFLLNIFTEGYFSNKIENCIRRVAYLHSGCICKFRAVGNKF